MARGSIKTNYILNLFNQMLSILTPLIVTPYISRVLGAERIGDYSYAESIASYFVLVAILGTATYAQREISYCQEDIDGRSRIFWNTFMLRLCTTVFVLSVYLLIFHHNLIAIILSVNIISVCFDISWFFQGIEEFGKIVKRNVVFRLVNIIFVFSFIKSKEDLPLYVFGIVVLNFLGNISMWTYLPKYIHKVGEVVLTPFSDLKVILSLFIPTVAIQIYTICDKTMIGIFTDSGFENGYYEQALKIVRVLQFMVTSMAAVMAPRIGSYFAQNDKIKVSEYMFKAYNFAWFIGVPLCFGTIGISDNIVPWFLGPGYDKVIDLLKILPILVIAIGISNVTGVQYLLPTKKQNIYTRTVILGAVVNLFINLLLIPRWFSLGAAIASVIAEVTITFAQLISIRREIDSLKVFKTSKNYLISGVLMICALRAENVYLNPSFINSFIMVISGGAVYTMVLLLLRDRFLVSYIMESKDIILRKIHYQGIKTMKDSVISNKIQKVGLIKLNDNYRTVVNRGTELLYYFTLIVYILFSMISTSMAIVYLTTRGYVLSMVLVLGLLFMREAAIFLLVKKYDIREYIGMSICILLGYIAARNDTAVMICTYMLIFGARNIDLRKTYKIIIPFMVITIALVILAANQGILAQHIYEEKGGLRHTLGFNYPLVIPCYILNISMMIMIIRQESVSWIEIIALFISDVVFHKLCIADLSGGLTMAVIIAMAIVKIYPQIITSDFILFKLVDKITVLMFPVCFLVSLWLSYNYDNTIQWMNVLNTKLRTRISLMYDAVQTYGIKIMGQRILFVGLGLDLDGEPSKGTYNYVDNLYISILLRYGILFSVIVMALLVMTMVYLYKKKARVWLWMLSICAVHCLIEDKMHFIYYDALLLIIGQAVNNINNKRDYICRRLKENRQK